jgi:replicative DNA helicase
MRQLEEGIAYSAGSAEERPYSAHAERTILGAMMVEPMAIVDATILLRVDDFALESHRRIYEAMLDLNEVGRSVDIITVSEILRTRKQLSLIGGPAYLAGLSEGLPRRLSVESYVAIVRDKSLTRQVQAVCELGSLEASDQAVSGLDILNDVSNRLMEISDDSVVGGFEGVGKIVKDSFGSIDELYEQGREVTGLRTHYADFDKMTSGLQDSELTIIAARPSMGKTAWAINIAENACIKDGKVVAVFSLEMSKSALVRRLLASQAMVNSRAIQNGMMMRADRQKLTSALERLIDSRLFIDDTPGITLAEMRAKARRLKQQNGGLDLIVIDYLQLMTGSTGRKSGFENRTQEVSAISRGLKALAKEMKIPVVALSQLSRSSEQRGGDKKPMLSDLRESGSIEQDADVVAFIHREEYYDRENEDVKGKAEIIVAKQRNGPTGTVHLAYLADYTRFENLETGAY